MALSNIIAQVLGLTQGFLHHFITGGVTGFQQLCDGEWIMYHTPAMTITPKGSSLIGALADITVYGATMLDQLLQTLVGTSVNISQVL